MIAAILDHFNLNYWPNKYIKKYVRLRENESNIAERIDTKGGWKPSETRELKVNREENVNKPALP